VCARLERAEHGTNPFVVARTSTGYVALADVQYHRGYTIFASKRCVPELHELPASERERYLREMAVVAHAVYRAFEPRKLNYELLGNGVPHLHWHLFPRHADDPHAKGPVWGDAEFLRALHSGNLASDDVVTRYKATLLHALQATDLEIERRF
jgi:diadenosine tetraphosphate (Ap4A) HIT family hydrolase